MFETNFHHVALGCGTLEQTTPCPTENMPFNSASTFSQILLQLSVLRYVFKSRSKLGLYDLNKHSERFFAKLLNLIHGWELLNLNDEQFNFPTIDLGDDVRRICVQVTANNSGEKVYKTVAQFTERLLSRRYSRLIILIITEKRDYMKGDTDGKNGFSFKKNRDIWDIDDLLAQIERLDLCQLQFVQNFLNSELSQIIQAYAPSDSLLFKSERRLNQPPTSCASFLKSAMFEKGSSEWDAEFKEINNLYSIIANFSRKQREYLAFIIQRGQLKRDYDAYVEIAWSELNNLLGLPHQEISTYLQVLEDRRLASYDDEQFPAVVRLHFAPNDFDFFSHLKKTYTTDNEINRIIVDGNFGLLD